MKRKSISRLQLDECNVERKLKSVRIDSKTTILVNRDTPDNEARENWLLKKDENYRKYESRKINRVEY